MKVHKKITLGAISAIILLIGVGILFIGGGEGDADVSSSKPKLRERANRRQKTNARRVNSDAKKRQERRTSVKSVRLEAREKPRMLFLDDEEERELTDLARKVLASLQAALDAEDFEQIRQIFDMTRSATKGSLGKTVSGMPDALKKKMIEALGWFGAQGLPEMLDFLADANPEVSQMAIDRFEEALTDITLGDRERAKIVVMASTVLTDNDALEQIFMEISNMRNTVAANTIYSICQDGTPQAKALMPETISFVTGEDDITTVEGLENWVVNNPDGEDDDDLYGPMDDK